ncbi:glycosyltransferase family 4 protein [Luteococcus sp. H138]|uniref:glycosyltransferase family 4 protein n=1 Tax=unclassified Luteococcus TaxID=2639923 RepID=UPI00313C0E06
MSTSPIRALWVTNAAAPYRIPIWAELARRFDLRIGLLETTARLQRKELNRGDDWVARQVPGAKVVEYRTVRVKRGEDTYFGLPLPDAARDLARADVVLLGGWDSPAYWQLLAQARLTRKPAVGFYESTLASRSRHTGALAAARRRYFHALDRVVVPGPAARDAVLDMGVDPSRVLMGFNAVDSAVFRQTPAAQPHTGHRFLYVGQFIARKNLEAIVDAFAEMADEQDRLTLVGQGELRATIQQRAADSGVGERVHFVEYLPNNELPGLMAEQDCLVLASHVEVWGLVVNEALESGMQVVVTANCGVAPSVAGMPGVHLASADASDLADVMRKARADWQGRIVDPPIRKYTPERFAGVFEEALRAAIASRGGRDD